MSEDAQTIKTALDPLDQALVDGVLEGAPRALARAITLAESTRPDHARRAAGVLDALLPSAGRSIRLGISGSPGSGKSTFIEALGMELVGRGRRVAVLAVDPSSTVSGGSILGDKTRMERLSVHANAFIRPSPSRGATGGVGDATREAILVCEAAGFDVVIVETVGVGQSETAVAGMVDVFALLQLPNAGDELQAMKKGAVELADVIVVNKADLDPAAAETARGRIAAGLSLFQSPSRQSPPVVLTASAAQGEGVAAFWSEVERLHADWSRTGVLTEKRRRQAVEGMWALIDAGLRARFRRDPRVRRDIDAACRAVEQGEAAPSGAARRLLGRFEPPQT